MEFNSIKLLDIVFINFIIYYFSSFNKIVKKMFIYIEFSKVSRDRDFCFLSHKLITLKIQRFLYIFIKIINFYKPLLIHVLTLLCYFHIHNLPMFPSYCSNVFRFKWHLRNAESTSTKPSVSSGGRYGRIQPGAARCESS